MIGILLKDGAYEQDIRELLMAFYPGEAFAHEADSEAEFYVKGSINETGESYKLELIDEKETSGGKSACFQVDYGNRFDTKNKIKRALYEMLRERTGKELPWGTLTGIRPAKIITALLEEGKSRDEIYRHMKETYLTGDQKIELAAETAEQEQKLLKGLDYRHGYSLYIGIPFCPTTCLYCSFTSYPISRWKGKTQNYLDALYEEMEYVADALKSECHKQRYRTMDTVYFGGGTPTSLTAEELDQLLTKLDQTFDMQGVRELTVEAGRPDSITREKLAVLKKHRVSRISINPQTMKQETLDLIGRRHTVNMVKECFYLAREMGFDNINMDLIIGLPGETLEDVRTTMEEIKSLEPDSITVHTLAVKRAARLNLWKDKYEMTADTQEMIGLTAEYAKNMGMKPYYLYRQKNMAGNFENVGYAKPGKACLYNILIMEEKQTILGCGAGTSTKIVYPGENRLERVENVKDAAVYIERVGEMIGRKANLL